MKPSSSASKIQADVGVAGSVDDSVCLGEGVKREGDDVYEETGTYVYLELQLHKPLIPKRPASVLATR